ncbi:MAG: GFA family protein [Pseudomonadota bacterium]
MTKFTGGCHCGEVRYEIEGEPHFSAVCHCPSCRKSAGAPLVGWAMFDASGVSCDRSKTTVFGSSEGVRRSFCGRCGTTLYYEADFIPGLIDITTESFDDPSAVLPTAQIWTRHETDCVRQLPEMHRFEELPPQD